MKVYSAIYPADAHLLTLPNASSFEVVFEPKHLEEEDSILILHGGADISPSLYGQLPNKHTYADSKLSNRDEIEVALAREAFRKRIPIFGICRGAQLLCALNGGTLVQHVTGHNGGKHRITTVDGTELHTTSAHHQMMNPGETEHELLAWSTKNLSSLYLGEEEKNLQMEVEPEVVFFPKLRGLAVQGHPEWMTTKTSYVQYCLKLITEKLCTEQFG